MDLREVIINRRSELLHVDDSLILGGFGSVILPPPPPPPPPSRHLQETFLADHPLNLPEYRYIPTSPPPPPPQRFRYQHFVPVNDASFSFRSFRSIPPTLTLTHQEYGPMDNPFIVEEFIYGLSSSSDDSNGIMTNSVPKIANLKEVRIEEEENDCSICMEGLCREQIAGQLPCSHLFHKECIGRWLKNSSSCPLCRGPA